MKYFIIRLGLYFCNINYILLLGSFGNEELILALGLGDFLRNRNSVLRTINNQSYQKDGCSGNRDCRVRVEPPGCKA